MDKYVKAFLWLTCWSWLQTALGQQEPISTFHPLNSKAYGIAEGLPDRCVDYAFIDNLGKLNIIPCQHAQISYGQLIYQINGYQPFLEEVIVDSIELKVMIHSLGMNGDSINFGRMIRQDEQSEGNWSTPYFYTFRPDNGSFSYFEVTNKEGHPISIINALYESGKYIACGVYRQQAYIFEIREKTISILHEMRLDQAIGNKRNISPFFRWEDSYVWLLGKTIYHFGANDPEPGVVDLASALSPAASNISIFPGRKEIFAHSGDGKIYRTGDEFQHLSEWYPSFLSFKPQRSYMFRDQPGNILFSFHKDDLEYASYLLDTSGQWHDYTEVIKILHPTLHYFDNHPFASSDFTNHLLQLNYDFKIIEVRSSNGITAIPATALRGLVELDPSRIYGTGNILFSRKNNDWQLSSFNSCRTLLFDGQIFRDEHDFIWEIEGQSVVKYNQDICDTIRYQNLLIRIIPMGTDHFLVLDSDQKLLLLDKKTETFEYIATATGDELNMQMLLDDGNLCWLVANKSVQYIDLDQPEKGFTRLNHPELDKDFISIDKDPEGRIWLGTFSHGLYIYDQKSDILTNINESNGLSNNSVATMLQDDDGDHWIGTFNGITVIDKHLNILGQIYEEDGLVHNECNRWSTVKLNNGHLGFGTVAGLSIIDPVRVKIDISHQAANKVFLSSVTLPGEKNVQGSAYLQDLMRNGIQLPANNRNLKLTYGLSQYTVPEKSIYAYRFEGLQDGWNYVGGLNELYLLNLPQGNYNVEIKAWDYRGIPSQNTLSIPLHVAFYFYQQIWFYLICLTFVVFLLYTWYRNQQSIQRKLEAEVSNRTATIQAQTEKLKEMDEVKTRLYTNITHEFRTPLTIIRGLSDQIQHDPKAPELIKRNADSLLNLVNQMLDLRKLESGNLKLELKQIDIIQFLNYICESFQSLAAIENKQFHFLPQEDEIRMDVDQVKLGQVIHNLFSNALKFTSEGDHIYVQVDRQKGKEEKLKISISDTGMGIPEEKLSRIFDRFYQVDDSMTRQGEGTGIGLTLVAEFVKLMQGVIEVKSNLGRGTTFQILLPISRQAPVNEVRVAINQPFPSPPLSTPFFTQNDPEKYVLLIVEDNPDVIHYLGNILQDKFTLLIASNGQDGIDRAIQEIPDLIISDVMMPVKDGYELCDTLKNDIRTSHIPIILLTARADMDSKLHGLRTGADAYLPKPFHQDELLIRINALIGMRLKLQERYSQVKPPAPDPALKLEDQFMYQLNSLLDNHLSNEDYDIQQICEDLNISRSQLHKKLKALTGSPTSHYIRNYKLIAAEALLLNPEFNVSEVAYQVGFKSPKYFTRLFKEKNGLSPTEWIARHAYNMQ